MKVVANSVLAMQIQHQQTGHSLMQTVAYTRGPRGGGGGQRPKKIVLQFWAPVMNLFFFHHEKFSDVDGLVGQAEEPSLLVPPPPLCPSYTSIRTVF